MSDNPSLPTGTVTFLFTDIEGSTKLWEKAPDAARAALVRHDEIVEGCVDQHNGMVVRPRGEGDSRFAVFSDARDSVAAAAKLQMDLNAETWETPNPLRVRVALHTGIADLRMGDYYGSVVNRCARLRSIGSGGQTLLSLATAQLVQDFLPKGTALEDMGEHRLKDLTRPEQVFQLSIHEIIIDFPPLKSLNAVPNNLPVQLTEFVGRETELAEVGRLLSSTRLLTLIAPGGTGKTRLAIQAAGEQSGAYSHGVFLVPLAPINSPDVLVQTLAEGLGLALSDQEDPKSQLFNFLRNKNLLLVLDNFEHVIAGAGLVSEILQAAPEVTILATSRQKLNQQGETVLNIPGMRLEEWASLDEALTHSSVQLFLQSAERAQPGFSLSPEDLPHLIQILNFVQGMPLGILLAAAWVDMLPLNEIAAEIEKSLDFLETDQGGVPDRQRSIRAVFEYSWSLLDDGERELFKKLAVFRGGFTRQAAQKVTGASLRALAGLVNKSLLVSNTETARYEVHELLRQYAQEQLESQPEDANAALEAHASYYADFMEESWAHLTYKRQKETVIEIVSDIQNVREAWGYRLAQVNLSEIDKFIHSLWFVYEIYGWYHSGDELFQEAVEYLEKNQDEEECEVLLAQVMGARAWFMGLLGQLQAGEELSRQSIDTLKRLDHRDKLIIAINGFAICLFFQNRIVEVRQISEDALEISTDIGNLWWQGLSMSWIGSSYLAEQNLEMAKEFGEKTVKLFQDINEHWGMTWPGQVLAGIAKMQGNLAEARDRYLLVLNAGLEINFRRGIQYTYNNLGEVEFLLEEYDQAETNYLHSLKISEEIGQIREMLGTLYDLARVWDARGKGENALKLLSVILAHPAGNQHALFRPQSNHEYAETLRAQIESHLDAEVYAAAWEGGQGEKIEDLVAEMLKDSPQPAS